MGSFLFVFGFVGAGVDFCCFFFFSFSFVVVLMLNSFIILLTGQAFKTICDLKYHF